MGAVQIDRASVHFLQQIIQQVQMKKNISNLVAQIGKTVTPQSKRPFKVTCQNAHEYTNKIRVDAVEYNRPSATQKYISEEMEVYPTTNYANIEKLQAEVKKKIEKPVSIDHLFAQLVAYRTRHQTYNILMLQDFIHTVKFARREDLVEVRPKLKRLENELSFQLEKEDIEQHIEEALESFLLDLNEVINKSASARVY